MRGFLNFCKWAIDRLFLQTWPRKTVALLSAVVIWFLVNQSITLTRTLPDVAVRMVNLPSDKTVVGLLPNGLLSKHIAVTVTGRKSVISDLQNTDFEVVIDAEGKKESWLAPVNKRCLVNLSPEWDLRKTISDISASDIFIKMSRLVVDDIPVTVVNPIGDPPKGYQLLNVWPRHFLQRVSGPEEQINALKKTGLELTLNLNKIKDSDLKLPNGVECDEITYFVPPEWKQITLPFRDGVEILNDSRAKNLRIDFLKEEFIALGEKLPITLFFPPKYSRALNPEMFTLGAGHLIESKNGIALLNMPLYVKEVSRRFLSVVRENIQVTVIVVPRNVQKRLTCTIELINEKELEENFVALSMQEGVEGEEKNASEELLRTRFREYVRHFKLYTEDGHPLALRGDLGASNITLSLDPRR